MCVRLRVVELLCVIVCEQVERTMCAERMKLAVMQGVTPVTAFANNAAQSMPTDTDLRPPDVSFVANNARRRGALGD